MVTYLRRSYEKARNEAEKITGETMDREIRNWLYTENGSLNNVTSMR